MSNFAKSCYKEGRFAMKKIIFALAVLTLTLNFNPKAKADEGVDSEIASDVQLDSQFEKNDHDQLQIDQQFLAKDTVTSQKELNSEKSKVASLKAKNERLNSEIRKNSLLAEER